MKTFTALAGAGALLALAQSAVAQTCEGTASDNKLSITVVGVRSAKGQITSTLYPNDEAKFLVAGGSLKVWRTPAVSPHTQTCIWLPGPGTYAVVVYHDANSNGKWDHKLLSFEGIGFSKNPKLGFSKPALSKVIFDTTGADTILHIKLRYP
jgi:uncharacterized protein (DUF2141 family)